jgi:hypothetical protein
MDSSRCNKLATPLHSSWFNTKGCITRSLLPADNHWRYQNLRLLCTSVALTTTPFYWNYLLLLRLLVLSCFPSLSIQLLYIAIHQCQLISRTRCSFRGPYRRVRLSVHRFVCPTVRWTVHWCVRENFPAASSTDTSTGTTTDSGHFNILSAGLSVDIPSVLTQHNSCRLIEHCA